MLSKNFLESLYNMYNERSFVTSDPIQFLYRYTEAPDIEIAGLIVSSLAYGRVAGILSSVSKVLNKMKPSPYSFLVTNGREELGIVFKGFKHRFTTDKELTNFLLAIKQIIRHFGSLENCFAEGFNEQDDTIMSALNIFVHKLLEGLDGRHKSPPETFSKSSLLPDPSKGSACKRLNMFLRWMVRKDNIDPGIWEKVPASKLIMPIDVHIHRISLKYGLTMRKSADLKTAVEITKSFRRLNPDDPVKYDFALTRPGIMDDKELKQLLELSA